MTTDVIIIGGGAAGLCSAVYLKKKNPNLTVRIIESSTRVGKKLALTGNGRCNITNKNIEISRYHGENSEFCRYALENYDRFFTEDFFESIGVPFVFEGDKGYPASLQAASVVDCLRFAADELGVITHLESKVTNIQISNGKYKVIVDRTEAIKEAIKMATKQDIIVLAGKGHETYQEINDKKEPFDERKIITEIIEEIIEITVQEINITTDKIIEIKDLATTTEIEIVIIIILIFIMLSTPIIVFT